MEGAGARPTRTCSSRRSRSSTAPRSSPSASATSMASRSSSRRRSAPPAACRSRSARPRRATSSSARAAAGGYILPSRDLVVNDMEIAVEGAQLDGMICLSSCDKTPPAHLMAAGRFNIPTILVICGYQPSGRVPRQARRHRGRVPRRPCRCTFGKLSPETLRGMADNAIRGPGVCSGMATANSMHVGVRGARDGAARQRAGARQQPAHDRFARRSARRIVEMVLEDLKPRDILTAGAFRNAVAAVLAVSGSINCIKHLQATAVEAGARPRCVRAVQRARRKTCRC